MTDTILALDLARVAGAAWEIPAGGYETRAFALGKPGKVDDYFVQLDRVVTDLVFESGCKTVSIEADTGRGKGSVTLRGYHAVAAAAARRLGCDVVRNINSSAARKLALGYGGGSKEDAIRTATALYNLPTGLGEDEVGAVTAPALRAHEPLLKLTEREFRPPGPHPGSAGPGGRRSGTRGLTSSRRGGRRRT
ncbi:hypothetical protein P7D22_14040 [Lichenihabitans sp. Uapishka_5]|uniref:hypothetical protein n=1 Tax=Lichenihabitans sp. Uapishka_5 TaxID=3037302 RepID=UPI0029E7E498|nr:hypothetical protein [Lichenihabitans sp. Uapishka_5]MDX7952292.1 hypothetical protein [Lichenihabitans sp. Uapishka_5]